jgi:adenosine deaminase CECR1
VPLCTGVCFELCPISNVITASSARLDLRLSTAPILLGLGVPVSINSDDPGKFGYEDSTVDYFCASVSFNWTLKHLKLVALHSINHAICAEGLKSKMHRAFRERWSKWIQQFLAE